MSYPDCDTGSVLGGTPLGTIKSMNDVDTYFVSGTSESQATRKFGVVFLTDAFGLELVNNKLIADKIAKALGCDVWVPDLFQGQPMLKVNGPEAQLLPDHPGPWPLRDKLRLFGCIARNLRVFYCARSSVVTPRTAKFIRSIREQNNYGRLGAVGHSFGAGIAVDLVPFKVLDSFVLCHPSLLTRKSIKAIDVPTAWACAEQDMVFSKKLRLKAEAIFSARKNKPDFVPYEFVDYKETVHGFACRPNLAYEDAKAGFEGSLSQTIEWFRKTLAS